MKEIKYFTDLFVNSTALDDSKNTTINSVDLKLLISHDGNWNNCIIDRVLGLHIVDEDNNIDQFIPSSPNGVEMSLTLSETKNYKSN